MADVTNLFRATIKAVRSRQKLIGLTGDGDKPNILSHVKQRSDFEVKAKAVVKNITRLKAFLLEHRKNYINAGSHLTTEVSCMTDTERDQIDTEAHKIIKVCQETIKAFRQDALSQRVHPQVRDHRNSVFDLINSYLKDVCKLYSEQRAIRVKRVVDRKRISRLEPEKTRLRSLSNIQKEKPEKDTLVNGLLRAEVESTSHEEDDISPEEAQLFEQENKAIFDEMNSLVNEVRQIEGKVVEISRLQEVFAEKVLQQDTDIDRIADTAIGTTENIQDGNEEIRKAMKNNAGFRVWILFFLVMCSFSLLFLDWYNG